MDKDKHKKGAFKETKKYEGKIKGENKKVSEPIRNEEQLEVLKDESTVVDKTPKKLCC